MSWFAPRVALSRAGRLWWGQLALVLFALAFSLSTVLRVHSGYNTWLDGWLYSAVSVTSAALCLARALLVRDRERPAWLAFGCGLASFSGGGIYSAGWLAKLANPPQPSGADIGYLSFYPLAYVGVVLLMRSRLRHAPKSLWLDGLVGGLATASVAAAAMFEPIARSAVGNRLAVVVNLAYPAADLLLLALVIGCFSLSGWRPDRSWFFMGTGLLLFAISDTGYLLRSAQGTYVEGTILDVPWTVGLALLGLAPWRAARHIGARVFEQWTIVVVPILFACAALGVLTIDRIHHVPVLAVGLAAAAVLACLVRLVLTFREVRSLGESRREARTDELTELGNRRYFYERAIALLRGRNAGSPLALLLIDLDRFKEVNDSLGHQFGDKLLSQIGPRLRAAIRGEDAIARLGGDEFTVIIDGARAGAAMDAAIRIRSALEAPFTLDGVPLKISASVGIALFPDHALDTHGLLRHADVAMYSAKLTGSGHELYQPERDAHTKERLHTIDELRRALDQHRLVVHYQPKVNAMNGRLVGAEALVRLMHPTKGIIAPNDFLPLAEQAGLMRILTGQVLELVLDDCVRWRSEGKFITVAVNLSVTNLLDADFPADVERAIQARGLPGNTLVFEITESTVLSNPDRAREAVEKLRSLGAKISLDDYGTGYASLAHLRQLPLDELKLDRSFISDLDTDPIARAFVSSAVQLAHALSLRVVAEGIETQEMWDAVREAGCNICQGFLFSKPLSAEQFMQYVDAEHASVS